MNPAIILPALTAYTVIVCSIGFILGWQSRDGLHRPPPPPPRARP